VTREKDFIPITLGSIKDDFWCRFLNIWIVFASILYDTTRYVLPGKLTFSYYTCAGLSPELDQDMPSKRGANTIETLSILLYIAISLRIFIYKRCNRVLPEQSPNAKGSKHRNYALTDIEKNTIAGASSNFLVVFFLILYIYLFFKLKSMHHLDFNLYPNYLFIYFHQLLWAGSFTFGFCILYYCTHRPLRLTVIRELKTFIYCSN